jgi:hypothetical protein
MLPGGPEWLCASHHPHDFHSDSEERPAGWVRRLGVKLGIWLGGTRKAKGVTTTKRNKDPSKTQQVVFNILEAVTRGLLSRYMELAIPELPV